MHNIRKLQSETTFIITRLVCCFAQNTTDKERNVQLATICSENYFSCSEIKQTIGITCG